MAKYRSHSIEFKRQIAQEFLAGDTLHGLEKRHDISRNLIRVWVERYQAGAFDEDAAAADLLQQYEARIAALERLVGKQALELEFLKGGQRNAPPARSEPTSAIARPEAVSVAEGCRLMGISRSAYYDAPAMALDDIAIVANQLWVADITYLAVTSGFVYVAVILDAWSRRVVGYAISRSIDVRLTLAALNAAIEDRKPPAGCLHHSDSQRITASFRAA
jgi:transposase